MYELIITYVVREVRISSSSGHDVFFVCGTKSEVLISEVMCDQPSIMADEESSYPEVRVFMTEKEALWYEFKDGWGVVPRGTSG